ncbi:MAG: YhgE/Pip domain-containing protein [Coriobacteriales bacterium]|nr:YhgE/Pip domain-containing protein [Coriobacteriales bacterium]
MAKAPAAWSVALFLVLLPSLYTWFNVAAFWNPYDNTGNLRVCLVNEDAGATDELVGNVNIGDRLVTELRENHQLGWDFCDRETAMGELEAGRCYAVLVIPADFSREIVAIVHGAGDKPSIEYYVNEKSGPVSPKITDTGANMLDTRINEAFVSTVAETLAATFNESSAQAVTQLEAVTDDAVRLLNDASARIEQARGALRDMSDAAAQAQQRSGNAIASLNAARNRLQGLSQDVERLSTRLADATRALAEFSTRIGGALDETGGALMQALQDTDAALQETLAALSASQQEVASAIEQAQTMLAYNQALLEDLHAEADALPDGDQKQELLDVITKLEQCNESISQDLADLQALAQDLDASIAALQDAANATSDATSSAMSAVDEYRTTLQQDVIPQLTSALGQLSSAAMRCSQIVAAQSQLIDQGVLLLRQLDSNLSLSMDAISRTDALLFNLRSTLDSAATDLAALEGSFSLGPLDEGVDVDRIANFMLSPTRIETQKLYPLNSYGTAMAPLFINLTLWVGVFMLMVIIRKEVDAPGIEGLTINQRFFGRGAFMSILAVLQAATCCTGCLILGVQSVNVPLFFITAMITSLVYLCIQYTLSTTLQHIGMGLCIVLVFVQIPGASGIYPIEMTPDFFQSIYPWFPFTYGIDALRETIGGFYPGTWSSCIGTLLLFGSGFLLVGSLLRPYTINVNRLFSREVSGSDLLNAELVQTPEQHYRVTQLIAALANQEEFRKQIEPRRERFMDRYPLLKRAGVIAGVAVPVVGTAIMALFGAEKVAILTAWLLWFAIAALFLITVEYIKDSYRRRSALNEMSETQMRELYTQRERIDGSKGGDA